MLNILLAVVATAAMFSMAIAGAAMIYDTTLPYPGIGKKGAKVVAILWLWPLAVTVPVVIGIGLGWLWGWAL